MSNLIAMTGVTGFAGGHVLADCLRRGHRVRALVRRPEQAPDGIDIVAGDLADASALARLMAGADVALHLAGAVSAPDRVAFLAANHQGSAAVVAAARAGGVKHFVHVSSLAARAPDISDYALSKAHGEAAVRAGRGTMSLAVVRPPAVYGPGDRATLPLMRMLASGFAVIPGSPRQRFSLIFVSDLARHLVNAVAAGRDLASEPDDGTPGGYGWSDLLAVASGERGRRVRALFLPKALAGVVARLSPASLALNSLGQLYHPDWVARGDDAPEARTRFAEGYPRTLAWYRARGWLPPGPAADRDGAQA